MGPRRGHLSVGSYHTGTVSRIAAFGAFVTLKEGVDGLIHISKMGAGRRINHPREVVKEGQSVEVQVEAVDREQRKISLCPGGDQSRRGRGSRNGEGL